MSLLKTVTDNMPLPIQERRANPDALATALEGMAFLRISRTKWYQLVDHGILPKPIKMGPSPNSAARWPWGVIHAVPEILKTIDWDKVKT